VRNKIFYLIPALLWTTIVTVLCLISCDEIPMPKMGKNFDKLGHLTFHFGITALWFLYFKKKSGKTKSALVKAFLFSLFFGIAIEISQALFTTTRQADVLDVAANSFGAVLAIGFIFLFRRKKSLLNLI
jgi:VanZ family protein